MQGLLTKNNKLSIAASLRRLNLKLVLVIGAVCLFCVIASAVWGFSLQSSASLSAKAATPPAPAVTVTTQQVAQVPIVSMVNASGTVAARHTVDIGPELSGLRITEVNFEEGAFVKRGQVLARLNSELLQAQLSSARASLQGAIGNVEKARQPNRSEDIAGLEAAYQQALAGVSQAAANLKRAETNVNNLRTISSRYENLKLQGAISIQDALDKSTAASMASDDVAVNKQQLEAARFSAIQADERLKAARAGGRPVDVSISQASAAQIQATIRQIQAQIEQTIIKAPADGIITKRNADVGEISSLAQPLFSMSRDNSLELRAQVQEIDLPAVKKDALVTITPASPGLKSFRAKVREVSPVVDSRTRLGIVYIDIAPTAGLKEGMYASSAIQTGTHLAMAVPTKAIRAEDSDKFVFVVNGNMVSRRPVKLGATSGDLVEVFSGLHDGERIVLAGAGFLKDGDTVSVNQASTQLSSK